MSSPFNPETIDTTRTPESVMLLDAPELNIPLDQAEEERRLALLADTLTKIIGNDMEGNYFTDEALTDSLRQTEHFREASDEDIQKEIVHVRKISPQFIAYQKNAEYLNAHAKQIVSNVDTVKALRLIGTAYDGAVKNIKSVNDDLVTKADTYNRTGMDAQTAKGEARLATIEAVVSDASTGIGTEADTTARDASIYTGRLRHVQESARLREIDTNVLKGSFKGLGELYEQIRKPREEAINQARTHIQEVREGLRNWDVRDIQPGEHPAEQSIRDTCAKLIEVLNKNKHLTRYDPVRAALATEAVKLLNSLDQRGIDQDLSRPEDGETHKHVRCNRDGSLIYNQGTPREYVAYDDGTIGQINRHTNRIQRFNMAGKALPPKNDLQLEHVSSRFVRDDSTENMNALNTLFSEYGQTHAPGVVRELHKELSGHVNFQTGKEQERLESIARLHDSVEEATEDLKKTKEALRELQRELANPGPDADTNAIEASILNLTTKGNTLYNRINVLRGTIRVDEDRLGVLRVRLNKNRFWQKRLEVGSGGDRPKSWPIGGVQVKGYAMNGVKGTFTLLSDGRSSRHLPDGSEEDYSPRGVRT